MKMRDMLNLLEGDRIHPSKKHGSDYDYDETTLQSLERHGVGKGPSIEDQRAKRSEAQKNVELKRLEAERLRLTRVLANSGLQSAKQAMIAKLEAIEAQIEKLGGAAQ